MASPAGGSSQPLYQIYGLASGFDTQGIIDATLDIYRQPLESLLDRQDETAFKREIFREVNDALYRLQQVTLNLRLESTFRSKIVTSSDDSVVTAIATTEATRGTHTIEVDSIAEAARAYGDVVTSFRRTDLDQSAGVAQAGGSAHGTSQGTHTVNFTSGYAGRIAGWVTGMDLGRTLASYGVGNADGLTIQAGGGARTLTGLTTESTVRDLVQRINQGGTGVTAEIKNGRLALTGSRGGVDFALSDNTSNYTDSIAAKVFGADGERLSVAELIGGRQVTASDTLGALGVLTTGGFDILVDGTRTNVAGLVGASTVQDFVDAVNAQVSGVDAAIRGGRIVISAETVGTGIELADTNYSDSIAALVMGLSGRQNSQGPAVNGGIVNVRASSGANITGGVAGISLASPLASYGVTTPNGMIITGDGGTSYTVDGLTGASTVQDLVDTINGNAPWVQAKVLGGRLVISSYDGGTNFTLEDVDETSAGIASQLLGLNSPAAATNIVQSTAGTGFGSGVVADAAAGKNASIIGQVPAAGALDESQQLSFYGLADADVTGFGVTVGTVSTNAGLTLASQTVGELVQAIDDIDGVRAGIYDGRLLIESEYGNRDFTVVDQNYTTDIARVIMGLTGERTSTAAVTGATDGLVATDALSAHGVTDASGLTISVDGTESTISGLTGASTVQDLVDAINAQVAGAQAELTDDGRITLWTDSVHSNFTMSDANYYGTIAGEIFGLTRPQSTLDPSSSNAIVNAGATGAVIVGPELTGATLGDTLNLHGVTTTDGTMSFRYRGETLSVSFDSATTIQQLVDSINGLAGIRADFVGGRFLVAGEDARENLEVFQPDGVYLAGMGFRELLGIQAAQATDGPAPTGSLVAAASTDEYTAADLVLPLSGGNPQFHTEVGSEGHVLSSLYTGGLLQGTGINQSFTSGTAHLFTSAELASGVDTASLVEGGALVGERGSFTLDKTAGTGTAQSLVGNAVFDGTFSGTYQVYFVNATDYVLQTTDGTALGDAVVDGTEFVSYENSVLAGSSFTFTSATAPAAGATWEFTLGLDATRSLADAGFVTPATEATNGTFTINGTRITITDYTTETVETLLAKINSAGAGVVANYDVQEDRFLISATEMGADGEIEMGSVDDSSNFLEIAKLDLGALDSEATQQVGVDNQEIDTSVVLGQAGFSTAISGGTFTINGVKLYVDPTQDSLSDVIERINGSAANVIARYDRTGDRIVVENDMEAEAISSNTIRVRVGSSTDTSNFLGAIRMVTAAEIGAQRQVGEAGEDASFSVDGITYSRTTNSVNDVITGVTLDIRGVSDGLVTLDVEVDTERGVDAIAEWVGEWNEIVLTMNPEALTDEQERYLDPLSDSDRSNMTFAEIEEYEALNRQYRIQELIRTDSSFRRIFYEMRNIITQPVDGLPNALDALLDLGIEIHTPLDSIVPIGQLVTDSTDKEEILEKLNDNFDLTEKLRNDEEGVTRLFGNEQYEGSGAFVNTSLSLTDDAFTMPSAGGALKFQIGDGTNWSGTITLEEGRTYSRAELLDLLDKAGLLIPEDDDYSQNRANVRVGFSGPGDISFSVLDFQAGSQVWFRDLSEGTNDVNAILGVELNQADAGVAEALHALIGERISSTGILGARTRVGGSLDRQILSLQRQVEDWQRRVALKEYYLNRQFSRFEAQLAEVQQMGQAVTNLSNMLAGSRQSQNQ